VVDLKVLCRAPSLVGPTNGITDMFKFVTVNDTQDIVLCRSVEHWIKWALNLVYLDTLKGTVWASKEILSYSKDQIGRGSS